MNGIDTASAVLGWSLNTSKWQSCLDRRNINIPDIRMEERQEVGQSSHSVVQAHGRRFLGFSSCCEDFRMRQRLFALTHKGRKIKRRMVEA